MSEFGNETATATMRLGEKALDAMSNLTKFLGKWGFILVKMLAKRYTENKEANTSGLIDAKKLQQYGEPIEYINTNLSEERLQALAEHAKKFGLQYSLIHDKDAKGDISCTIMIKEKELKKFKAIYERMTDDAKTKIADDNLKEFADSFLEITPENIATAQELLKQKEDIVRGSMKKHNDENADIIYESIMGRSHEESLSFEKALNRFTDRDCTGGAPYCVCERTNPNNYIEMTSYTDKYNGKDYIRTDYKVFNEGIEQFTDKFKETEGGKFTDKRFNGRPKNYWAGLKSEMKEKGGFTDDIVIFNSKKEFERYKEVYTDRMNDKPLEKGYEQTIYEKTDYASDIIDLENELKELGGELAVLSDENGEKSEAKLVYQNTTEEILPDKAKNMSREQAAECVIITKQIENFENLSKLKATKSIWEERLDKTNKYLNMLTPENEDYKRLDKGRDQIIRHISETEKRINDCYSLDKSYSTERSQLNGICIAQEVYNEYSERDMEYEALKLFEEQEIERAGGVNKYFDNIDRQRELDRQQYELDRQLHKEEFPEFASADSFADQILTDQALAEQEAEDIERQAELDEKDTLTLAEWAEKMKSLDDSEMIAPREKELDKALVSADMER